MLLDQLPPLNTPYRAAAHKDYFLHLHQALCDSIPQAPLDERAVMQDIAAAWGSYRAYKQIYDLGDKDRIVRIEKAMRLNLQIENILSYGEADSIENIQEILFPKRLAILDALKNNQRLDDIHPLADVPFSYRQRGRFRAYCFGASLSRFISRTLFGLRTQQDIFTRPLPPFPEDNAQMMIKEHHIRHKSVMLEYLSMRYPASQPADRRLLIRVEGCDVHYAERVHRYVEDYQCMNAFAKNSIDMVVVNNLNMSTHSNRVAKNLDEFATGVEAVIEACIQQGYQAENITLLGTCAGSQIASYVAARNVHQYPIKCISDRSFSSFEQVMRGHINTVRLTNPPNAKLPLWQYILLRIICFPLYVVEESITRILYATARLILWSAGWQLQQATHINTIPLHRLQVFQAKAYNNAQSDDRVLPHAHISLALEERRSAVLDYLSSLAKQPKKPACLSSVRDFIEHSYQVYTEGRNSKGKPHDPHYSLLHELYTHEKKKPFLQHIAEFVLPTTSELDAVVAGLPVAERVPGDAAIHPLLILLLVGVVYASVYVTIPGCIPPDGMTGLWILAIAYCAYHFCYNYIEASCAYFQEEKREKVDIHCPMIKADTIRFAAPLLVRMEEAQRTEFIQMVGATSRKKS
jgi:hypothetical protein